MKIEWCFEYDHLPSEYLGDVGCQVERMVLCENGNVAPSFELFFKMSPPEVDALREELRFLAKCANDSGEDPYDALVLPREDPSSIKFSGNIARVLQNLREYVIYNEHFLAVEESDDAQKILERGKAWHLTWDGRHVVQDWVEVSSGSIGSDKKRSALLSASGLLFAGEKRKRSQGDPEDEQRILITFSV